MGLCSTNPAGSIADIGSLSSSLNMYISYIIKNEIKKYSEKLYNEMMDLQSLAKEILEFYR